MHGAGEWKPMRAASSLAQGAEALAEGGNISTADYVPRPEAVRAIKSRVGKIVGTATAPWLPS